MDYTVLIVSTLVHVLSSVATTNCVYNIGSCQIPGLKPPPISVYWSHPRDPGVRLHWGCWRAPSVAPTPLHQNPLCSSRSAPGEHAGRPPPNLWQTWTRGTGASGQRRSLMLSALERVPWWWAQPQGDTWREGGAEGRMYNEGKNKALRQQWEGLSSAVSGWLMWPQRIAFDTQKPMFSLGHGVGAIMH